jgi:hypothetical protein
MFFDPATNTAFGSLGWVDHNTVWCWDAGRSHERRIAVPGARHVSVRRHADGLLRLIHHGEEAVASIRSCADPEVELASLRPTPEGWRFHGDSALWGDSLALLMMSASGRPELLLVNGPAGTARSLDLSWFNDENYDRGYQGLVDCVALPEAGVVVVSVQRSSELVLIDPERNAMVGSIQLADRGGNPTLRRWSSTKFFASDYDSLCLVDAVSRGARCSGVLQPAAPPHTNQFTGDYALGETTCVVARPFSGDVLQLGLEDFAVIGRAEVPGQPLSVCMTSGRAFLTRDWQTGKLESGEFAG